MKKYRILSLLLVIPILTSLLSLPAAALEDPVIYCNNAVLYDANYGAQIRNRFSRL